MKKRISEDLSFGEKYGLAMEQGARNVEQVKEQCLLQSLAWLHEMKFHDSLL